MPQITNLVPKIRLNEPLLRASLTNAELEKVCTFGEVDWLEVYDKYGSNFIFDESHLIIITDSGIETTLKTTDFLKYFSINLIMEASDEGSDDIPFWEWRIFDNYVVVSVMCGGPDGGLLIIDAHDKPTFVATTPDTIVHPVNIIFAPRYRAFICLDERIGFDELAANITVISLDGKLVQSDIYLNETGQIETKNAILMRYNGPYVLDDQSLLKYVEDEDLLIFSLRNDYRNIPLLASCNTSALLKQFDMFA